VHEAPRAVVLFSGGGTGGHLYPALALAEALAEARPDVRAFFVGARQGVEARILPARGVDHHLLPVRGLARREGLANARAVPALLRSVAEADELFRRLRPDLVVVTGGYAGAPAGLVAVLRGVPLVLQEQNSVPGITTRGLARWARQIHLAFPEAAQALPRSVRMAVRLSGNPVRPPVAVDRVAARAAFGLDAHGSVVLVVGGSQGSATLNRIVGEAVAAVGGGEDPPPAGLQLLWATGPAHLDAVRSALGASPPSWVRTVGYIDDMHLALGCSDLAVSRAGAMATAEFLAWGVPMILVPLPTAAADHQRQNARALEEAGTALHLPEAGLSGAELWHSVMGLVGDPARLEALRKAARERGRPGSARRIAAALAELLPSARGPLRGRRP
jgi:UDP-N-acetylglucosamine--N-acetylmuramyl-(pentapeptide) pyrophosphoryl-undecaprenol N-acetylglucosamine transferase